MLILQLMTSDSKPFRIYDASAGSGKTFTLAREYLKLLLRPGADKAFRQILAITFTNKAVAELKHRILNSLTEFATVKDEKNAPDMFLAIRDELNTDVRSLSTRSRLVLQELLHNYAFFDVSTIDKFNHRILRTFSQDLELPPNFEVVLDTDSLLLQAVDSLIQKAGSQPKLTGVLIDFALEKTEEDRSWDISLDLFEMGKLLFDENHYPYLETFSGKTIDDFIALKELLAASRKKTEASLAQNAQKIKGLFEDHGLDRLDFKNGYFPDFVEKIYQKNFNQDFAAGWKRNFGEEPLYPKKADAEKKQVLDDLLHVFCEQFNYIRKGVHRRNFLVNAYTNISPFAVLGLLKRELDVLRDEEGYLPISSFNAIISRELKDQPVPYIYERLGERYRHFFIDEFQDTSRLQWENLVPLIGNALEGEDEQGRQGSLVLVGDAKQAIYRWRGGKAEQFLGLIDGSGNPFAMEAHKEALPKNYRSHKSLIDFNNEFFSGISGLMSHDSYSELFQKGTRQIHRWDLPGLVRIEFVPPDAKPAEQEYLSRILQIIRDLRDTGYEYRDISILTRRRKEGILISNSLMQKEIPVISSETLLLKNHPGVQFLIHLLEFLLAPEDKSHAFGVLLYLSEGKPDRHGWIIQNLSRMEALLKDSYGFNCADYRLKSIYDLMEGAIRQFELRGDNDAYLIFLMDLVLEVSRSKESSIQAFLEYWRAREDKLSILAPEGFNAITLMTIHKSKGLEFPVVIFPFADTPIYGEKTQKIWLPVDPDDYAGFQQILVTKKKELKEYENPAPALFEAEQEKQELDAYNLLYVAHTRAIKALFVISKGRTERQSAGTPQAYGDLYTRYLREKGLWQQGRESYSFGRLDEGHVPLPLPAKDAVGFLYTARDLTSLKMVTKSGIRRDSEQGRALRYGNIIHYALSLIQWDEDINPAMRQLISEGLLEHKDEKLFRDLIGRVVSHPLLSPYFKTGTRVLNERDLLTKNGLILRPDRLVFREKGVAIIDYKTGQRKPEHRKQILQYAESIEEMGYTLDESIIIYIEENQITPEFI